MLRGLIGKVVGDPNEREIQKLQPLVEAMNGLEPEMERRTDAELGAMTDRFRSRLATGDTLDEMLVETFAAVREAAKRTVDMRPFDVQLVGGIVLHQGKVAEMRTGEGKTLVATMPVYLNALSGKGVHLVTVNDYLARRDTLWMGPIYHLMGLSIGLLQSGADQPAYRYDPSYQRDPYPGLRPVPRKEAYAADIVYGTNNEFGFDYLRDNIALTLERRVQRPLYYAIVDEVDNIFIDEARTPLIISGPSGESVEDYSRFAAIARQLEGGVHYELDEKERSVFLTEEGLALVEQETGIENIYDEANYRYVHYMQQALKAQVIFQEGRDYIRQRKQIILIDQHTGRLMPSRRLSEGLHQAIEAKEGVPIRPRDVTSATITIQNYFRMYEKLAGMSGTAVTEAEEFFKIYKLDVLAIPTNKPVIRTDHADVVYRSEEAKLRAVGREILACHSRGQPVLVGTTSVEMSERLSKRLTGERLQMAALAPRIAYALQDADLDREERVSLRETMNSSLETMNPVAWRRMMRQLDLNPNALTPENLSWIAEYLEIGDDPQAQREMEHALREGIAHEVLNAKEHTREAGIIARAGEPGAVTIATNMAGRGVDIKLGGDLSDEVLHKAHQALQARGLDPFTATPAQMDSAIAEVVPQYAKRRDRVLAAGGLHVLGTERHEARRIDNQLRGRSGRQGEPGSSRFYLSLEDDLMRRFGRKEMLSKLMEQIGDDFPIEHGLVSKTIERAQTSVEGYNFDIRKHLLEYDDVLNRQRETIYEERLAILQRDDLRAEVWRMLEGQVEEYVEKYGTDAEQRRLLFAGMDDVVPLILPAPNGPFQGPLPFGSHLTAFPPFTISFLADQLAEHPPDTVQQTLQHLSRQAASSYGEQIRQIVSEATGDTVEKYAERLDRYRSFLDEKIEDYLQLAEERGQVPDGRRLADHLQRTFPLRLTTPREANQMDLDSLRDFWQTEVEAEFHRQTCAGLIDRIQVRLPADVRLDRLRPAVVAPAKLNEEMHRVLELARKQPRGDEGRDWLSRLALPTDASPARVLDFIGKVKESSDLDFGRLDRLVAHVMGTQLEELLDAYIQAVEEEQGRTRRDLQRMQESLAEGKKGGRTNHLPGILGQLNDLVHLEIATLGDLLGLSVAHEYDKWAQRQLLELYEAAKRNPLDPAPADSLNGNWATIAEHLLNTYYTQKQVYDRGHRRQATWMPRLPFGFVAQAQTSGVDQDNLRDAVLDALRWAVEQRERVWGQQELQRWSQKSLESLGQATLDGLLRYLGERELAKHGLNPDDTVQDLPPDLYDHLRFILAMHQLEARNPRLGEMPYAEELLEHLEQKREAQVLDTPFGELDMGLRERAGDHLRRAGYLDDVDARTQFVEQRLGNWDRRTRDEVARLWGQQYLQAHKDRPLSGLDDAAREAAIAYLQDQHRFVDEERIQHFLVHERLSDLPPDTQQAAVLYLAHSRLDQLSRRKISNLDVKTRQSVIESLQRMGLFTDQTRRQEIAGRSLADLESKFLDGFGAFLARQHLGDDSVGDLEDRERRYVIAGLKESGALIDPERAQELETQRLSEIDGTIAAQIRERLVDHLRADLSAKTMEELPVETRRQVHRALSERNYFVDQEKVGWYERNTLAQLPSELLRGLEQRLGEVRLDELAGIPFRDLPVETRNELLDLFDAQRLLTDRAERLRVTQAGTLSEMSGDELAEVARHLGRQWLVSIRDRRPPVLPDKERELVWAFLRDQGYFSDEFKEELFAYQRLDEFQAETQQAVEAALIEHLASRLASTAIGELPPDLKTEVKARVLQTDHLVDEPLLQQIEKSPASSLSEDLRRVIERALGAYLLSGQSTTPIAELAIQTQNALWRYLDETGYFVDEKKRSQILERRLADLGSEQYEAVVRDLAYDLATEIGDRSVSELDDELRQGLREALEVLGFFESDEMRVQLLNQPLGGLRREDLDAMTPALGEIQMNAWADKRLRDLPDTTQEKVLSHLQTRDWFLDRDRLNGLQGQRLGELEASVREDLIRTLRRQHADRLQKQRLASLGGEERHNARDFLRKRGLAVEEAKMRPLRSQKLHDLEQSTYRDLLQDLGEQVVADWRELRFGDMDHEQQAVLSAYLGRRIIGRIERRVLLHTISRLWIDYLTDIEDLRRGIGLEAYGQRDPLVEYKRRAFELFEELGDNIRRTVVRSLFRQPPEALDAP